MVLDSKVYLDAHLQYGSCSIYLLCLNLKIVFIFEIEKQIPHSGH